jgi:hypothetical protein
VSTVADLSRVVLASHMAAEVGDDAILAEIERLERVLCIVDDIRRLIELLRTRGFLPADEGSEDQSPSPFTATEL